MALFFGPAFLKYHPATAGTKYWKEATCWEILPNNPTVDSAHGQNTLCLECVWLAVMTAPSSQCSGILEHVAGALKHAAWCLGLCVFTANMC
jgi:hypothetical protein